MREINIGRGVIENYYLDNWRDQPGDTGVPGAYGDSGVKVLNPSGQMSINLQEIILDVGLTNVGDTYQGYKDNPLQITIQVQSFPQTYYVFLPLIMKGND
jgi:hypothetical protein